VVRLRQRGVKGRHGPRCDTGFPAPRNGTTCCPRAP
jgi:hypothetical protein